MLPELKDDDSHSGARLLGQGCRQILQGKWRAAANTLGVWPSLGRYCGFVFVLAAGVELSLLAAYVLGVGMPLVVFGQAFLVIALISLVLLPFSAWLAVSLFGWLGFELRAGSFRGGFWEGMLLAFIHVAVGFAVAWLQQMQR